MKSGKAEEAQLLLKMFFYIPNRPKNNIYHSEADNQNENMSLGSGLDRSKYIIAAEIRKSFQV